MFKIMSEEVFPFIKGLGKDKESGYAKYMEDAIFIIPTPEDIIVDPARLNMKQIQFVKLLVDYVIRNGTIDMQKLTEQPFNTVGQVYELFGNNVDLFKEIKEDIEIINGNAEKLA